MTGEHHPALEHWRANVGHAVSLDVSPPLDECPHALDVLCWNVAIGKGRLRERLETLLHTRPSTRPLVVLVQEAYRSDETVPDAQATGHHGGQAPRNAREDIVDVARGLGLSLRYEPSMRNGKHRSDRGNAILSTVAFEQSHPILLPYVRQRRTAIVVKLAGNCGNLWFGTAHLGTRGAHQPHPPARPDSRAFGGGRAVQARALADSVIAASGEDADVIVAGDLNSYLGLRDPAVRVLIQRGFHHAERLGRWRHTFHGPINLMLDHVLFRPGSRMKAVQVRRLDEGFDREKRVFGSDHHPLLATVTFRE